MGAHENYQSPGPMAPARRMNHGRRCECLSLAAAAHVRGDAISFSYCHNVLQRRYRMVCRHGEADVETEPAAASKWHIDGPIDAVKAILVRNS